MKMGDGGYRPAYNIQLATDDEAGVIVGVTVSNSPADTHQLVPTLDDVKARTEMEPEKCVVDAGYNDFDNVEAAAARNVELYMPLTAPGNTRKDGTKLGPYDERPGDTPAVKGLRRRMKSEAGKTIYKKRSRIAERPNAQLKSQMGFTQFLVRGLAKVTATTLLTVLAFNVGRVISLGLI
jgi:IS5 family transposase